jgi:multiple sugar transport system permease protein
MAVDALRSSRRRRVLRENLTAYLFLLPAAVLIFLFGLFPVAFAFFVSLHRWRRFPGEYNGLGQYEQALGGLAYVLFFWFAIGALIAGLYRAWRVIRHPERRSLLYFVPGFINAGAVLLLINWFFLLLPEILNIPQRIRGQNLTRDLFLGELAASFRASAVADAGLLALLVGVLAIAVSLLAMRFVKSEGLWSATGAFLMIGIGLLLLQLTLSAIAEAATQAATDGVELPIWSQIILISAGAAMLITAYLVWTRAVKQYENRRSLLMAFAAILLMIGGYVLVAQLPSMLASADRDMLSSFSVTVMYSIGTVPFQLAIGLGLAYLLFQNLKGKTFFRMVFFMPYIMPFVATAMVFTLLFSHRQDSIVNHLVGIVGVPPQKWLLEPVGVGKLIFGAQIPDVLAGPPLALVVVIIYTIWTYAGYATVVFLAGLTNISGDLYEAARIDGASGWAIFRHITLPLLSPTTFFLSLISIIGTFQAFTQLWIMRTPAAGRSIDTTSVYIYTRIQDANPNYGYGSALAFVLFGLILLLTLAQNRIAGRRVFYG